MTNVTRRELIHGVVVAGAAMTASSSRPAFSATADNRLKPMLLQIEFRVSPDKAVDFEKMYTESYVPALRKQQGYLRSSLLRLFPADVAGEIQAMPTEFNYQMELVFDTEQNRRKWVASEEHASVWPLAFGMVRKAIWRGYDVVADDHNTTVA